MGIYDINGGGQPPQEPQQVTVDINQASDIE